MMGPLTAQERVTLAKALVADAKRLIGGPASSSADWIHRVEDAQSRLSRALEIARDLASEKGRSTP
jgi:hypothetical protein